MVFWLHYLHLITHLTSILDLDCCLRGGMQIFIKMLTGKMTINPSNTINDVSMIINNR